ncbi:MAG: gliding motility-associated C-terminal domain-containing protein [Saprospiraceae bacterium]
MKGLAITAMKFGMPMAWVIFCALMCGSTTVLAQPEFMMTDTLVTDCEGVLFDSELGDLTGHYDHNEDYVFTICITGADDIILDFNYFHTEIYDEITFYDGPNTTSPVISGPYSGRVTIPSIVASSGCLTIRFTSDANVAEPGWRATWRTSNFAPPLPPGMIVTSTPVCPMSEIELELSSPVHCDSLYAGAVTLTGPKIVGITSVEPIGCTGDSATRFRVRFAPELDFGGRYTLTLRTIVPYCTTPYILFSEAMFTLRGCPLGIRLSVTDPELLCEGGYTRVTASVSGGIRGTYNYTWSPFPSSEDTVRIGPITGTTTISVSVTDASGGSATAEIEVTPAVAPTIIGGDRSMCQSVEPFLLEATPPNGRWEADGMYYGYDDYQRLYDPLLTDGNEDIITYTAPNGCVTQVTYDFTPLDPGTDDGACPGAAPFDVSGGLPGGGQWSGPNIDAGGRFTPPADTGTWTVTYTHPNGCSGSKEVNVAPLSSIYLDTFCESNPRVELEISPVGGVWTGPGMSFGSRGWFSPGAAGHGPHTLRYLAEGCADVPVDIFVKEIDAFEGFTACPSEDPRILPGNWRPAGGTWYGRGIVEPTDGLFDPGIFGVGSDTLTYHAPNGCTDKRTASVYYTFIRPQNDTSEMCTADDPLLLTQGGAFFQRPIEGVWTGPGVSYVGDEAYFDPRAAGLGIHPLYYTANTCDAFFAIQVGQSPEWYGDTLCVGSDPVQLFSQAAGTQWSGNGIINPLDGIFDVDVVGPGLHEVFAYSPEGCDQRANVYVPQEVLLNFQPLDPVLCFSESEIALQLGPASASLSEGDVQLPQNVSSSDLGEGFHTLVMRAGEPGCEDIDSVAFEVLPALSLSAKPYIDTLCEGDGTRLEIEAIGGVERDWVVRWVDRPDWPLLERAVQPTATITYTASLSDGCSDSTIISLPVTVFPAVSAQVDEGPIVCHYDSTFAIVSAAGGQAHEFRWYTEEGDFFGDEYFGPPRFYDVEVTNLTTGCRTIIEARLPGYEPIVASISPNPNDCISPESTVIILDRSRGATTGTWTWPDGTTSPYVLGENPELTLVDTGSYAVILDLINEGDCTSRDSAMVCVEAPTRLWLPTGFTPNGDNVNDAYGITGQGIYEIEWLIVDRWGTIVFRGDSMDSRWDGTYKGEVLPQAVFTLRAQYVDEFGRKLSKRGFLTLVR